MDRHNTRRFLNQLFVRPEDLEAWLSDCFPAVWQQRGTGFGRVELVNLLFATENQANILQALQRYYSHELSAYSLSQHQISKANPYRGLMRFEIAHASIFFGRTELTHELLIRFCNLETAPVRLLALVGPSGSGKSSLLRAGLLASLQKATPPERTLPMAANRQIIVRPSRQPLLELASELARQLGEPLRQKDLLVQLEGRDPAVPGRNLDPQARALAAVCKLLPQPADTAPDVLICVDGLEEIYTQCSDPEEARRFVAILRTAARSSTEITVVATVRDDFLATMQRQDPELYADVCHGRLDVPGLSAGNLRAVIEEPARHAGHPLPPWVVERLLNYALTHEHSLPLLQFQLAALWDRLAAGQDGETIDQTLAIVDGSVGGLLAKDADQSYAALGSEEEKQRARRLFLRLVQLVDVPGVPYARRRIAWRDLKERDEDDAILTKLLQQFGDRPQQPGSLPRPHGRLLSITPDKLGSGANEITVELAHEALLEHWRTLRGWIATAREHLVFLARIFDAAKRWEQHRHPDLLLRGPDLAELARLSQSEDSGLNLLEQKFLEASQHQVRREQVERWLYRGFLGLFVALMVAFGWAVRERGKARAEHLRAQAESAKLAREHGRQSLLRGEPQRALHYLSQAQLAGADSSDLQFLLSRAIQAIAEETAHNRLTIPEAHSDGIMVVDLDPSAQQVLSASWDGVARLRELRTGRLLQEYAPAAGRILCALLPRLRPSVFLAGDDGVIREFDRGSGTLRATLRGHTRTVRSLAMSQDDRYLASVSDDGSVRIWDVEQRRELKRMAEPSPIRSVRFLPGDNQLVTASSGGSIRRWSITDGKLQSSFPAHVGDVWSAEPSPDGLSLLTTGDDGLVKRWDLASGQLLQVFSGARGPVYDARWLNDGGRVLLTGADRRVIVLDAPSWRIQAVLAGHSDGVRTIAVSLDGRTAVSAGFDRSLRVWDLESLEDRWLSLRGHVGAVQAVASGASKPWVATTAQDYVVRIWNAHSGRLEASLPPAETNLVALAFADHDDQLVVANQQGMLRLHRLPGGEVLWQGQTETRSATALALSPDGKLLATGRSDGKIEVWELSKSKPQRIIEAHSQKVYSLCFSPDGRQLLSGSADHSARITDAAQGHEIRRFV